MGVRQPPPFRLRSAARSARLAPRRPLGHDPEAAAAAVEMDANAGSQASGTRKLPLLVATAASMNDARREILERVTAATVGAQHLEHVPRAYRHSTSLDDDERAALFCERVDEYRAEVRRIAETDVAATVASVCPGMTLVVPGGIPDSWRGTDVLFAEDDALSPRRLDEVDGTLTGCTVAVAETGTIILTAGPHEGRRALTLVPDLHVCVVRESQIVHLLPEALALISAEGLEKRPITFISGPSATSDIELSRVEGVHGPRTLIVLVVKEAT